jgi:hypothetical protein
LVTTLIGDEEKVNFKRKSAKKGRVKARVIQIRLFHSRITASTKEKARKALRRKKSVSKVI